MKTIDFQWDLEFQKELYDKFINLMNTDEPVWIGRYGGSDTDYFINNNDYYTPDILTICKMNGFFYKNSKNLDNIILKSKEIYFNSLKNCDLTTICTKKYIDKIIINKDIEDKSIFGNTYALCNYSLIEDIDIFFPLFQKWGVNKKILIISPFSETIKYQTKKNRINNLLKEKYKFPNCEFITYQIPITYNIPGKTNSNYFKKVTENYDNWIELLTKMEKDIQNIDFDIAFISAGIYTMGLGNFIKKIGKKAIYMGGMLNPIFNIYGERYKTFSHYQNLEYQIDSIDDYDDLFENKSSLFVAEGETISAYFRYCDKT